MPFVNFKGHPHFQKDPLVLYQVPVLHIRTSENIESSSQDHYESLDGYEISAQGRRVVFLVQQLAIKVSL
eukprot:s2246_g4.t1